MPSASIGDIHIGQNGAWKVPGARWPAIVLAIVVLDVVFDLCAPDAGPSLRAAISDPGMTGCSKSTALLSSCNACRGLMFAAALA
jgi:hypothetical protein